MTDIVSSIKPEGIDYEGKPIVDDQQIWTSREQTKKAFSKNGFNLADYNKNLLTTRKHGLGANVGAEQFFAKVDI